MWAALGNFFKNKLKKTAASAAQGDDTSRKKLLIVGIVSICFFLMSIIVTIVIIFGPIMMAKQYIEDLTHDTKVLFEKIGNTLTLKGWCSDSDGSCEKQAEQKYFEKLNDTYESYKSKGTEIDVELITATIFYGYNTDSYLYEKDEDGKNQNFIDLFCEAHGPTWIGEGACEVYVKLNYDNVYEKYKDKYLKIASNYTNLKRSHCDNNKTPLSAFTDKVFDIPIKTPLEKNVDEACEFFLWEFSDLSSVILSDDSMEILYRSGKNDITKLADNMVKSNRLNYTSYRDYLVNTYIPKRFSSMYEGKTGSDKDKAIEKIADEIMMFASLNADKGSGDMITYGSGTVYKVNGNLIDVSKVPVVLLTCDGSQEIERVEFEKYIKGVTYAENEGGTTESLKAQAVAARTYTLIRNLTACPGRPNDCNYGYNPNTNEIRLRNCENDQVYCDHEQGCYKGEDGRTMYSGQSSKSHKPPMSGDRKKEYEENLNQVIGQVIYDENNELYKIGFNSTSQNTWNSMSINNPSWSFNDILVKYYNETNITIGGGYVMYMNAPGDYANWKQFEGEWAGLVMKPGNETISQVGCLVVSTSIQFARSGTAPANFDPKMFTELLIENKGFNASSMLDATVTKSLLEQLSGGRYTIENGGAKYSLTGTQEQKIETLNNYINQGYYIVLGVKNNGGEPGHWVAVDRIEGQEVYLFDPGSSHINKMSDGYLWSKTTHFRLYRIVR